MQKGLHWKPQVGSNESRLLWHALESVKYCLFCTSNDTPLSRMESGGVVGSRRREGKKYAVEDEALDRIAKEVSGLPFIVAVSGVQFPSK